MRRNINIKHLFSSWIRNYLKSNKGIAMVEFALALPVLCLLFFGMIEVSAANYSTTKSNFANIIIAHAVASHGKLQDEDPMSSTTDNECDFINNIFMAAERTVRGHVNGDRLQAVISIIKNTPGATSPQKPFVLFQQNYRGLASAHFSYNRGSETSIDSSFMARNAVLPSNAGLEGYEFVGDEQIIVVETQFRYNANNSAGTNFLGTLFHNKEIRHSSGIVRVRIGAFPILPDNTRV